MLGPKDFLALLEKIPAWKRLSAAPDRIDELERRLAALEAKPKLPICEACGEGYMRLKRAEAPKGPFAVFEGSGMQIKVFQCDKCGMETKGSTK